MRLQMTKADRAQARRALDAVLKAFKHQYAPLADRIKQSRQHVRKMAVRGYVSAQAAVALEREGLARKEELRPDVLDWDSLIGE